MEGKQITLDDKNKVYCTQDYERSFRAVNIFGIKYKYVVESSVPNVLDVKSLLYQRKDKLRPKESEQWGRISIFLALNAR